MRQLTDRLRRVIARAEALAHQDGGRQVTVGHLDEALRHEEHSMALRILQGLGVGREVLAASPRASRVAAGAEEAEAEVGKVPFAPEAKGVIERAAAEAAALGHQYVGTEHLLLALAQVAGPLQDLLARQGVTSARIREALRRLI